MKGKKLRKLCAAAGVVGLVVVATATGASAHRAPVVSAPIVDGLAGPLQFEVGRDGKVLVGQSFSGTVSTVDRHGTVTDLFNDPGVDGVASGAFGTVIYTHTDPETGSADLRLRTRSGATTIIKSTSQYDAQKNPDGRQRYGVPGLSPASAAQLPPDAVGIVPYQGIVESHPYAVTPTLFGWFVADAAANDILFVSWLGHVRTVAVLPPQAPVTITAEMVAALEGPSCLIGKQWITEPVPTDVELGFDGNLYVSTLPGGPEDPSSGARGSVYKVNPWNGSSRQIATGFAGATNLAVSPWGIFVSEINGNRVSQVVNGRPAPIASVPSPSGLEWSNGKLYVGTDTFGSGKIQTISF